MIYIFRIKKFEMSLCVQILLYVLILLTVEGLVIPISNVNSKRVYDNALSNEEHYSEDEEHNVQYDHEAFLGEKDAKSFEELTTGESKLRLGKIADKIDNDKNGYISLQELKDWIHYTQRRYIVEDADRQWKSLNPDNKSTLSWENYKKLTFGYNEDNEDNNDHSSYRDMIQRDMRRWEAADKDGDNNLSKEEFVDFVHPEEAPHMTNIVIVETMEDIDKDNDGKISIDEYIGDMYGDADFDEEPDWVKTERKQFTEFRDKDKNGYMDFDEVRHWILPPDYDHSEAEAKHLVYESDINRDNQLSKEEILNKYDLFVGSQATDFGEALVRHDEF